MFYNITLTVDTANITSIITNITCAYYPGNIMTVTTAQLLIRTCFSGNIWGKI